MRHRWDYGPADSYASRRRSCVSCGMEQKTFGVGAGRIWDWRTAGEDTWRTGKAPSCPQQPEKTQEEPGMRHLWEYEKNIDPKSRRCSWCWAYGHRSSLKSAWLTKMPDSAKAVFTEPGCPGTPWQHVPGQYSRWELWRDGRIHWMITDREIADDGRAATEQQLARPLYPGGPDIPALPEKAWEVLAA